MSNTTKHKAIAIPVVSTADGYIFLTARDRRHQEWLFVTGGCRKREISNPLRTALRELLEETRGVIDLKEGQYSDFKFSIQEDGCELIYTVFVFFVDYDAHHRERIVKQFSDECARYQLRKLNKQPIKRVFDENDILAFESLQEFNAHASKWSLIVNNVIRNPSFYDALRTEPEKRKSFNFNK